MNKDISPELVLNYFHDKCNAAEKREVENWLRSGEDNYQMAMRWLKEEESEDDEKFLAGLLVAEDDVFKSTEELLSKHRGGNSHRLNSNVKKTGFYDIKISRKYGYGLAASVVVILLSAWLLNGYFKNKLTTVKTAFAQTQKVVLPDSSIVILNGNSSLSYRSSVFEKERQVWMEGEAFFEVSHLSDDSKFLVHLSEGKTVEVLGTEFDVSERKNLSKIVLKSGKIRLDIPQEHENIEMAPGEMVEVDSFKGSVKKELVNSELYYSWIHGKWKFDGTRLREILNKLSETHGKSVYVYDSSLLNRTVSGTVPLHGESQILINNIANAFDLKIEEQKGKIYLKERK